ALWGSALDVRVTEPRPVSIYSTARMGILFADCLFGLGFCRARALSALPLVCRIEATPQRSLAQLFLNDSNKIPTLTKREQTLPELAGSARRDRCCRGDRRTSAHSKKIHRTPRALDEETPE